MKHTTLFAAFFLLSFFQSIHNANGYPQQVNSCIGKQTYEMCALSGSSLTSAMMPQNMTWSEDNRNQGSAKTLSGKTYVLTIFTGVNQWSKKDYDAFFSKVHEAQQWLTQQAKRYGEFLSFVNGNFGYPEPIDFNIARGTASGKESVDYIRLLMKQIGYQSPLDFVRWAKENALVLVVANKTGTSYAISYNESYDKEKYYLEGAIMFTKYLDGGENCAASIAHEICHLFGAEDLYETFQQTKDNEELARKLYPNDIMLRTSYNINELEINEMTAWFVGLSNNEKKWYRGFIIRNH